MGAELDTLFKLQQIDIELREKQLEVDQYESSLAGRRSEIDARKARIEQLIVERKTLVTERALAERKVDDTKATLKDRNQRIGRVRTERELRANEGEVADLREQVGGLEDTLLQVMQSVEDIEARLSAARDELADPQNELSSPRRRSQVPGRTVPAAPIPGHSSKSCQSRSFSIGQVLAHFGIL